MTNLISEEESIADTCPSIEIPLKEIRKHITGSFNIHTCFLKLPGYCSRLSFQESEERKLHIKFENWLFKESMPVINE